MLTLFVLPCIGCGNGHSKDSAVPRPPGVYEHVVDAIDVSPDDERTVSGLYDHFPSLIAGGEIPAGTPFPADKRFCQYTETHTIFLWSYYISPNELRGFEISIPLQHLRRNGEHYVSTVSLVVEEVTQKQMIKIIVMKEKRNKAMEATS